MRCDVCGNDYDKAFRVIDSSGAEHVFDSFECAIQRVAPTCAHCSCRVIGHGVEADGRTFCCANCAREAGFGDARDRVASDEAQGEELREATIVLDEPSG